MRVSIERRRELIAAKVTLDGRPAVICGVQNYHASVCSLDGLASVPFAWATVERIVGNGGQFRS